MCHGTSLTLRFLEGQLRLLPGVNNAAFNASGKDEDPLCFPNTRINVLHQIRTWADGDDGRTIFWLSGWAGTRKSTIARTISREYYDKGRLGEIFFATLSVPACKLFSRPWHWLIAGLPAEFESLQHTHLRRR